MSESACSLSVYLLASYLSPAYLLAAFAYCLSAWSLPVFLLSLVPLPAFVHVSPCPACLFHGYSSLTHFFMVSLLFDLTNPYSYADIIIRYTIILSVWLLL